MKKYYKNGADGLVEYRKNRITKTYVGLYNSKQADLDSEMPWTTICEDHGFLIGHYTIANAKAAMTRPDDWCEECQKETLKTFLETEMRSLNSDKNRLFMFSCIKDALLYTPTEQLPLNWYNKIKEAIETASNIQSPTKEDYGNLSQEIKKHFNTFPEVK